MDKAVFSAVGVLSVLYVVAQVLVAIYVLRLATRLVTAVERIADTRREPAGN